MTFNVQSEVGQLRQVIVHRPGLELSRLTPRNIGELLFDDVMWAKKAKEEHDAFAEALRDKGVRVHYFGQLLGETLELPEGRAFVLDRHLHAGDARTQPRRPAAQAVRRPRRPHAGRVPRRRGAQGRPAPGPGAQPQVGHAAGRRLRAAAAAQPPVPAGQLLLDLPRRLGQPDGQARPPARDAAQPRHLPLPPDVRRRGLRLVLRRRRRQPPARHRRGRRRARARPRRGADRHGRADHPDGRRDAGQALFASRAGQHGHRRRAARLARHDAPGHGA